MDSESTESTPADNFRSVVAKSESSDASVVPIADPTVADASAPHGAQGVCPCWLSRLIGWSSRLEWIAAGCLTVAAILLHIVVFRSAGGLWRDEINSINLAAMATLADVWNHIEYDSFPIFWVLVLRIWQRTIGDGDTGYRLLGFCVGLGCLAALWGASWRMGRSRPLFSLALAALSPVMLRYGDSLRAWGFGVLWMWLMIPAIWDYAREPTRRRWCWAAVAGVLCVQASYYNALLLFATSMGGCAICCVRRDWKTIVGILGAGLIAALTLVPYYAPIARHRAWVTLVEVEMTYPELLEKWEMALDSAGSEMAHIWLVVCGFAVIGGIVCWFLPNEWQRENREVALFSVVSLVIGSGLYLLLIHQMHRVTESWYYLSWMAYAGLFCDMALASLCGAISWGRFVRLAAAVAIGIYSLPTDWRESHTRHSNVDIIARHLNQAAGPHDLIAILNWEIGITFQRYYHGEAPWITVPDIADHRIHRYDLLKQKVEAPESIKETIAIGQATLASGGKVWLVGNPNVDIKDGSYIPPPPPLPETGWYSLPYSIAWMKEFKYQLALRSNSRKAYTIEMEFPVTEHEETSLQIWQKVK